MKQLSVVNMADGVVFTALHFLCNLQMGSISLCFALHYAGKAWQGQKHNLIGNICKL
jgi:hypothetical protein